MSVKRKSYSADFKAKLVLEVLEGKKQFLENMSLAFDKSVVVKEYIARRVNPLWKTPNEVYYQTDNNLDQMR